MHSLVDPMHTHSTGAGGQGTTVREGDVELGATLPWGRQENENQQGP